MVMPFVGGAMENERRQDKIIFASIKSICHRLCFFFPFILIKILLFCLFYFFFFHFSFSFSLLFFISKRIYKINLRQCNISPTLFQNKKYFFYLVIFQLIIQLNELFGVNGNLVAGFSSNIQQISVCTHFLPSEKPNPECKDGVC